MRVLRCGAVAVVLAVGLGAARADEPSDAAVAVAAMSVEEVIAALKQPGVTPERVTELEKAIGDGDSPRQRFARALVAGLRAEWVAARDAYRRLAKDEPGVAEYQARLGTAVFMTIGGASSVDQFSLAREGRAAYEATLEIDPNQIEPRVGLAQYFINAPAIAGGSYRKAREQGEALLEIPGGAFRGRMVLAQVAQAKEDWDEMASQYVAAESAEGEGASAMAAKKAHASALLRSKKDAEAALAMATKAEEATLTEDADLMAIRGLALVELERWAEARPVLVRVIEMNPKARRSRIALGRAMEGLGKWAEAKAAYAAYLEQFPEGEQADDAKAGIRRAERKLR